MTYNYSNVGAFMRDFREGRIVFPLKRIYRTDADIREMMLKLKRVDYNNYITDIKNNVNIPKSRLHTKTRNFIYEKNFDGRTVFIRCPESDYSDFNTLSDMFMEEQRVKCKLFTATFTPYDYFHKKTRDLAIDTIRQYGKITPCTLRETLWRSKLAKECTNFRPNLLPITVKYLLDNYGSDIKDATTTEVSILDPSSGWGDRLLGSIAAGYKYTGVDPNINLVEGYKNIIKFFKYKKATMICDDFLRFSSDEKFDIVFTSPPYFDMEIYSDDNKQSTRHKGESDWHELFLIPYLANAIRHLKQGGIMVVIINMADIHTYIYRMISDMSKNRDVTYIGMMSYGENAKKTQPIFVWKKNVNGGDTGKIDVYLRQFKLSDIDRMSALQSDPTNMKYIANGRTKSRDQTLAQLKNYIREFKNETYARFYAIDVKKDNGQRELAGYIGYYKGDKLTSELDGKLMIRILIDHNYQGIGIGTAVVKKFIKIPYISKKTLYAMVEENNIPSNKLFSKWFTFAHKFNYGGKSYNLYRTRKK